MPLSKRFLAPCKGFVINLSQLLRKMLVDCPYCDRTGFASERALSQHVQGTKSCFAQLCQSLGADAGQSTGTKTSNRKPTHSEYDDFGLSKDAIGQGKRSTRSRAMNPPSKARRLEDQLQYGRDIVEENSELDSNDGMMDGDHGTEEEDEDDDSVPINAFIRDNFQAYRGRTNDFIEFNTPMRNAIELMALLRKTKASLDTYEAMMGWHLKSTGQIQQHQSHASCAEFISRPILFKNLRNRYNMAKKYNKVEQIVLPHSKAKATIVKSDAQMVLQSLLTDPRIMDSDYLFADNDPFAPPKVDNIIADLNTGMAYRKTYEKLITNPGKQVLLPVLFYIDGAVTGQFANLAVTAVKMSIGIFNRKARDRPNMWRTLGYIPEISKGKSRGKRLIIDSQHIDAIRTQSEMVENEGKLTQKRGQKEACGAQDLHTMLSAILESYLKVQETGFVWDLFYNGKEYKGVEFVLFVPFIKCDTDEADQLCGKYKTRTGKVKQLCRYCECPTRECDDPMAKYPMKEWQKIQRLVEKNDKNALRDMSQQPIDNAFYPVTFGQQNKMGVHGATPLEMLHALHLGIYKYVRESFFIEMGESSQLAEDVDALAMALGQLFSRQSSRNKPKTRFAGGIRRGKLMAKEYTGIILCMLLVMRSTKGRTMLTKARRKKGEVEYQFSQQRIDDWIMLLETLLQWEEWMRSDEMKRSHVFRSRQKHRYLMYLIKKISRRTKGMGHKLTKFHCIMHIADDILNFGVPMEVDTGSNESGHKPTKTAARLTQKKRETFDIQTATRLEEIHLLDLAIEEISGRPLWDYSKGFNQRAQVGDKPEEEPWIGGTAFRFFTGENGKNVCAYAAKVKGKDERFSLEVSFIDFVMELKEAVVDHIDDVFVFTSHNRNGQIFRSSPLYHGSVWRDWVIVDWGPDGKLPCKLWGFIDLFDLPENARIDFGGLRRIVPGFYAIVESAQYSGEEFNTELVQEIQTDCVLGVNGTHMEYNFYLADVEAFVDPCLVIPNLGGAQNSYLLVKERHEWGVLFEDWLGRPHEEDIISDQEASDDDDEEEEEESSVEGEGNGSEKSVEDEDSEAEESDLIDGSEASSDGE